MKRMEEEAAERLLDKPMPGDSPVVGNEVDLLDFFLAALERRVTIFRLTLAAVVIAAVVVFLLPDEYTGTARILPPQMGTSSATAMLGELGALASLAGKDLGIKNPADLYIGILKSRTVADALIRRFQLQARYKKKTLTDTRKVLERHTKLEAGKDGIISIAVDDKDPSVASDMANAYFEELYRLNQTLAFSEASQRRLFFEKQLAQEKNELSDAEVELKKTQESTGLIQLSSQAEAVIRSVSTLKAQISAREVQLQSMRSFATEQNPEVIRMEGELDAMRAQLKSMEHDEPIGAGNVQVPTAKVPQLGLEYVRRFRDVQYHEVLFGILAKQYEAAKIDEGKSAPIIQVVDRAVPPDKKSGPQRSLIISFAGVLTALLACMFFGFSATLNKGALSPEQAFKLQAIRDAMSFRRTSKS